MTKPKIKMYKANPEKLPSLLDKDAEIKRLDSIRENAISELNEIDRLKEMKEKDMELIKHDKTKDKTKKSKKV